MSSRTRAALLHGSWELWSIPIVAVALVLYYRLSAGGGYPLDDSYIHLAFARRLAHGQGFGVNPGQWSTGSTAPLWSLLLSAGLAVGLGHAVWPWLLATAALAGTGLAGALVVRRLLELRVEVGGTTASAGVRAHRDGTAVSAVALVQRGGPAAGAGARVQRDEMTADAGDASARRFAGAWPILGGLLVVSTAGLVWSTAAAMETPLFTTLLLLAWAERLREEKRSAAGGSLFPLWGLYAGAALLARPEGILFALLLALTSRRLVAGLANLAIAFGVYAPYGVYCLILSGRIWPATFFAKTTRAFGGWPDLGYMSGSAILLAHLTPLLLALLALGLLLWAAGVVVFPEAARPTTSPRAKPPRADSRLGSGALPSDRGRFAAWRAYLPGVLFPVALPLAYASMGRTFLFAGGAGNFGRYFFPLEPFVAITALAAAMAGMKQWRGKIAPLGGMIAIAGLACANAIASASESGLYAHNVRDVNAMQVEMARRLSRDLPPGSVVAANDIGALAYFTDLRVLDLVGIVSPEVQRVLFPLRGSDERTRMKAIFDLLLRQRPAAMVVFSGWYRDILRSLGPVPQPLEEIHDPENISAAVDDLLAYRMNWAAAMARPPAGARAGNSGGMPAGR